MTKAELDNQLRPFAETEGMGAVVYFIMQVDGNLAAKRADIDDQLQPQIRDQFAETLRSEILDQAELAVLDLSAADDRSNAIYRYDLEEIPEGLNVIDEILATEDLHGFSFEEDHLPICNASEVPVGP